MSGQASQLSVESMEDCWSENEIRPLTTCWKTKTVCRPSDCVVVCDQSNNDASDVSLQSCNSTETLKQWTMQYPVTACCQPVTTHRRRRRKRRRRPNSDDSSDDDSVGEKDVVLMYTDCNGEVRCCPRPVCCPRKPCTLVCLYLLLLMLTRVAGV